LGIQDKLFLGNLDAVRDWGYAPEYIEAMWLMLQQDDANDYVVATGIPATVKEFLNACFSIHDLNWEKYVEIDPRYFRPTEVDTLIGDSSRALEQIGWKHNVEVLQLAEIMSVFDLARESGKKPHESLKWRF
jgi:GDPmannose 4,6-dehydratase